MTSAPAYILKPNTRVITNNQFDPEDTWGLLVPWNYLAARAKGKPGKISGVFGGHGGDVYAVIHDDGSEAAYCWSEFELV